MFHLSVTILAFLFFMNNFMQTTGRTKQKFITFREFGRPSILGSFDYERLLYGLRSNPSHGEDFHEQISQISPSNPIPNPISSPDNTDMEHLPGVSLLHPVLQKQPPQPQSQPALAKEPSSGRPTQTRPVSDMESPSKRSASAIPRIMMVSKKAKSPMERNLEDLLQRLRLFQNDKDTHDSSPLRKSNRNKLDSPLKQKENKGTTDSPMISVCCFTMSGNCLVFQISTLHLLVCCNRSRCSLPSSSSSKKQSFLPSLEKETNGVFDLFKIVKCSRDICVCWLNNGNTSRILNKSIFIERFLDHNPLGHLEIEKNGGKIIIGEGGSLNILFMVKKYVFEASAKTPKLFESKESGHESPKPKDIKYNITDSALKILHSVLKDGSIAGNNIQFLLNHFLNKSSHAEKGHPISKSFIEIFNKLSPLPGIKEKRLYKSSPMTESSATISEISEIRNGTGLQNVLLHPNAKDTATNEDVYLQPQILPKPHLSHLNITDPASSIHFTSTQDKRTQLAEDRHLFYSPSETCRHNIEAKIVRIRGCRVKSLMMTVCRGTCHSRSVPQWNEQERRVDHIEHCTCCAPREIKYRDIVFICPGRTRNITRRLGFPFQCSCRPCSSAPEVEAEEPYRR